MCQKDPDPSAVVRRTTPEVVRAPPDAFVCLAGVASKTARVRARVRRAAEQASCHVRPRARRHARSPARRRCSEPRSRSQQACLLHATAVSSGAWSTLRA